MQVFFVNNFIIHALPRSRTCWISKFLTYRDYTCHHETAMSWRTPDDYKTLFTTRNTGSAETGVAQGWWLLQHAVPGIKTVVIRRPVEEVMTSLLELDGGRLQWDEAKLRRIIQYSDRMLDKISRYPDVESFNFHDLDKMETCKRLFEFVLPYTFDVKWWGSLKNNNVQLNMRELLKYRQMHRQEIDEFKDSCFLELRKLRKEDPNHKLWDESKWA